jgi:RHH-type proline utilization regulon transcriptional repressor/proline dehydrogenase/delta 1-pyrroline-5-carboxylate dehydrogenase
MPLSAQTHSVSNIRPFATLKAELAISPTAYRTAISAAYRQDERSCVAWLHSQYTALFADVDHIASEAITTTLARKLVAGVRKERSKASGVDALMHEFSLSSDEGVALMCVAEALLRIPDSATADRLIADKISKGDWRSHLGESTSLFVNAATWGLLITGKLVTTNSESGLASALGKLISRGGEPLIRKGVDLAMRMLGNQFVSGQTIDDALSNSKPFVGRGYQYSYDMLGEAAITAVDAERYYESYVNAIKAIGVAAGGRGIKAGPGISVKLSALHPRYSRSQRDRVMTELYPRLKDLVMLAKDYDIGINIDAEEADRLELSLDLLERLAFDPGLKGFDGIGFVVQAYQKRCPYVIDYLVDLAERSGKKLMVRLVKGAYWDTEIKRAQVDGMVDFPVYTRKLHTDMSYLICAQKLLLRADVLYPQFATHNAHTLAAVYTWASLQKITEYEFQCLHGMGESLYDQAIGPNKIGIRCRIYAPVGSHQTLLAYLVRRLLENGANSSFVNQIVDPAIPIDSLIADPFKAALVYGGTPQSQIALPAALYGKERINSAGFDFSDEVAIHDLALFCEKLSDFTWHAGPLVGNSHETPARRDVLDSRSREVYNPADRDDLVGHVVDADDTDVEVALKTATAAAPEWQAFTPAQRAQVLKRSASLIEEARQELLVLAVREAGKSLPNALGEIREAVDFLRYYAAQVEYQNDTVALGVVLCISPWNFPLAIFIGQISAALAVGNVVLAKPAEQTPLIAQRAVELLHQAGVPRGALQLLPGSGPGIGALMTADPRVKGVVFTGSTAVAQSINRLLAGRAAREGVELPLIAETGGQNTMIVDSSALPEQVVHDVIASAFDSAGQRCSALRILCVQEEIADVVLPMLRGALEEIAVGNPDRLEIDIGPVIDAGAQHRLQLHIDSLRGEPSKFFQLPVSEDTATTLKKGTFILPTMIEIDDLSVLKQEVFGPVLHVLRYRRVDLPTLIDAINNTGFGLTLGIHSRIDETIDFIVSRAKVGNIYVNRSIVGAVVGSQPFGGEGKSGTGPKAGGPLYLKRLQHDPVISFGDGALCAPPARSVPCDKLLDWAKTHGHEGLLLWASHQTNNVPVATTLRLPGPTGERNTLSFSPRGTILCVPGSVASLFQQLAAVFSTGNDALVRTDDAELIPFGLPASVKDHIKIADPQRLVQSEIHLALVDTSCSAPMRVQLASRDGLLIPVIETVEGRAIPLWRLYNERALSVNTTAAGGNAHLMTLTDTEG